jgi:hypothetical protein
MEDRRSHYLIGAITVHNGQEEFSSYWANSDAERDKIFSDFLKYLSRFANYSLIHFGNYEATALLHARASLPKEFREAIDQAIRYSINLLPIIRARVYFPTYSNSLKEIGKYLGATWSEPSASGIQSLVWRQRWHSTGNPLWKQLLVQYNWEDCIALKRVAEFLDRIVAERKNAGQDGSSTVVYTDSLPKAERRAVFGNKAFALSEFKRINQCAYFDYQRDTIAARPGVGPRRPTRFSVQKLTGKLHLSKTAYIAATRCPTCRSKNIRSVKPISRTVIDLKFSRTGVKRWVVRYSSSEYACAKCKGRFVPSQIPAAASKFGWGLVSWCMYNYFVSGQNLSRIKAGLAHLFRLNIPQPSVHRFREHASERYRSYCRSLSEQLMQGPYLHIDETAVKLRSEKGYVWILTNGDSAYYFYRDSREGGFLRELLKGFSGVLISDFFTAYDSLEFRQQRCLIHLLRDFNEEMLKTPYDEQLRELGNKFSQVLGAVVGTVDAHGLRKRHLSKHKGAVKEFVEWVTTSEFKSRASSRLQTRIIKYKDMLFTFLDYDDVSWNNNSAEVAIKSFARYRRFSDGKFTARSIEEYLILLTVFQTCEYRGVSFLEFMLGKGRASVAAVMPRVQKELLCASQPLPGFAADQIAGKS